jgi:hypothetical protein
MSVHNSYSYTYVGKSIMFDTGFGFDTCTDSHVSLEVNTHTKTLDYFISDKHIKSRVVNVPKDVYFGV